MRRLAVIGLLVGGVLSGCGKQSEERHGTEMQLEKAEARGRTVFRESCERCHPQREAGLGPRLSRFLPKTFVRWQVRQGLGSMPPFGVERISDEDLRNLSEYLASK